MEVQADAFLDAYIRPALARLDAVAPGADSEAAERLLLGTALVESGLVYVRQIVGPALGYWQMEPNTARWMWAAVLDNELAGVLAGMAPDGSDLGGEALVQSPLYAAGMARAYYLAVPEPLPDASDIKGLAQYWKDYWNTVLGKGRVEDFVTLYYAARPAHIS